VPTATLTPVPPSASPTLTSTVAPTSTLASVPLESAAEAPTATPVLALTDTPVPAGPPPDQPAPAVPPVQTPSQDLPPTLPPAPGPAQPTHVALGQPGQPAPVAAPTYTATQLQVLAPTAPPTATLPPPPPPGFPALGFRSTPLGGSPSPTPANSLTPRANATPPAEVGAATMPSDSTLNRATLALLASLALVVVGLLIVALGISRQLRQY
jgi:hypothetical protein